MQASYERVTHRHGGRAARRSVRRLSHSRLQPRRSAHRHERAAAPQPASKRPSASAIGARSALPAIVVDRRHEPDHAADA
jgi:hypothetical protein